MVLNQVRCNSIGLDGRESMRMKDHIVNYM